MRDAPRCRGDQFGNAVGPLGSIRHRLFDKLSGNRKYSRKRANAQREGQRRRVFSSLRFAPLREAHSPLPFIPQPLASSHNWKSATLLTNCSVPPVGRPKSRQHRRHPFLLSAGLLFSSVQRPATGLPSLPVQHTTPGSVRSYSRGNECKPHASFDLRRSAALQPNRPNAKIVALLHEIFSPSAALTPRGACQEDDARTRRSHRTGNTYLR